MEIKYVKLSTYDLGAVKCDGTTVEYDHRRIIDKMTAEGYTYAGWIPVKYGGYGQLRTLDLVFMKDENK